MSYRVLDPGKTVETISILQNRIIERFPSSGLGSVCDELYNIANEAKDKVEWIKKPNILLRTGVYITIFIALLLLIYSVTVIDVKDDKFALRDVVQLVESVVNDIVFIGIAIFFLTTVEIRIKRSRALAALHELRAISHVIDMHQLTKDPGKIIKKATSTASSPQRTMTAFELTRYLDYCSEMLALTGKISALYAQNLNDSVVLAAVNELESLTTGLSRKIWQKIIILHKLDETR